MEITISVDPQGNGQIIYSPDLDTYLQIYLIPQSTIDAQTQTAQDQITAAQMTVASLSTLTTQRTTYLQSMQPVQTQTPLS